MSKITWTAQYHLKSVTVAWRNRRAFATKQVASSSPGCVGYILFIEPTITQRDIVVLETVVTNLDCVSTSRSVVQVPSEQGEKLGLGFEPPETVVSPFWKSATSVMTIPPCLLNFWNFDIFQKLQEDLTRPVAKGGTRGPCPPLKVECPPAEYGKKEKEKEEKREKKKKRRKGEKNCYKLKWIFLLPNSKSFELDDAIELNRLLYPK